jgi:protein CpxP
MERSKLLTIAVIGLLLLNVMTLGFLVFRRPPHPPHGKGGPAGIIIERLQLDEQQKSDFRKLADVHHEAFVKLTDNAKELRHRYYNLLREDVIDTAKADSLRTQMSANQGEIDKLNLEHFQQIRALCTPKQKERFNGLAEEILRFFHGPPPPDHE